MIEFKNVTKKYPGGIVANRNLNFTVETGEFVCLIGTSGSGKTTAMRMINCMETPTTGSVLINGADVKNRNGVELRRSIGYVIQRIGLMPHMTIYENVAMVPRLLKWDEERISARVGDLMKMADLDLKYLDSYPSELSGGQQQRVGVIRALAADQEIVLMDEPFGALDPITRKNLQQFTKALQKELGKTIVFVTHDMDEALDLGDRIAIMDAGEVVQYDTPEEILLHPANDFVRNLLGEDRINQALFDYKTIDEIMIHDPVTIGPEMTLRESIQKMHEKHVDMLFVIDEKDMLLGYINVFSLQDSRNPYAKVKNVMEDAVYLKPQTRVRDAIFYVNELGYRNIPVADEGKLVGLITRSIIVDAIYKGLWQDIVPESVSEDVEDTTDQPFSEKGVI